MYSNLQTGAIEVVDLQPYASFGGVGDFLLSFNAGTQIIPPRDSHMQSQPIERQSGIGLTFYSCTSGWQGFPLITVNAGDYQAWLFGEIFGLPKNQTSQQALQDVIDKRTFAADLNGNFLLIVKDNRTQEWHLWTNRFGTLHAYYANDGRRAAIGTFSPAVAAVASRHELDWLGLAGFFTFGFFTQDRTHFADVRILRPASHYVFDRNGMLQEQRRYWQWQHRANERRSYDDTVEEFGHTLGEVMEDQTSKGHIAVPISGGLDSRTAVAFISSAQTSPEANRFWSYSYGYSDDSVETHIAAGVAAVRRLPFQSFTIESYLFNKLELIAASVEGFQDFTQCRQASICENIAKHADYLIAAHWGDVWLDDCGLSNEESNKQGEDILRQVWQKLAKGGSGWLLENLCYRSFHKDKPEAFLRQMLQEELSQVAQIEDTDFRVKAFKTDQWSFRWTTASLRMFQPAAFPRLPFYDTRMADFFCTVPSRFVAQRRLQIDYLKRFAPDLARLTWQVHDANLFRFDRFNSWLLPKRALKKARRLITGKHVVERNWEVQFLNGAGQDGLAHWLLRPGLRLHQFVAPAAIQALVDAFYAAPFEHKRGYSVSMLLTFSVWLELYG
jgi:asparagine synthase (glutamine-hydrolysing)